jgi:hypothetical protein
MNAKITSHGPEMCECGRLFKDRRDKDGKMMCSACYTECDVASLKKLWGTPIDTNMSISLAYHENMQTK